ncbi:carbohydrate sulfotransferase 15-like [Hippocampus zosterae]|uniref:carbohydrate sulfotransferase 15-like n=1 Tax=Hippocampus zosterae TaxID=109293 RepID=UPI00223D4DD0|nr:carbohydrate sulfotransferase 15-like [Hippocampus zosterae]
MDGRHLNSSKLWAPAARQQSRTVTHMDYKYTLLDSGGDDYRKRPLLLQVDRAPMNLFAVLQVKPELPGRWSAPGCFGKVRLCGVLLGVAVTFVIMASYTLTGDRKDLLLTPSPYHHLVNPPGPFAFNLSSVKDYAHLQLVVKSIVSKVEFHSARQLPELKALVRSEQHMFSVIPRQFLPGFRNPCWYEEYAGNVTSNPYRANLYAHYARRFRAVFQHLRDTFREHLRSRDGKLYRIRCLPYFYIIGQPKCGTTDLYDRLRLHPDVKFSTFKEPHWWTRKRFGIIRLSEGFHERYPVEDYLDLFDQAAHLIQGSLAANNSETPSRPDVIIGEASASTMWDNNAWVYFYDNATTTGGKPPFLIQDFVHALQPDARFIVMLRDPVERLYSDYLYFGIANKSAEDFHEKVSESLQLLDGCLSDSTLRSCVYNTSVHNAMPVRLHVGLYVVYLLDWLSIFSREQILVLRLEDHASNMKHTMHTVFRFLGLGPLSQPIESELNRSPASNSRRPADKDLGPMLPATQHVLHHFYAPFNRKLAQVLHNDAFLWDSKP